MKRVEQPDCAVGLSKTSCI